MKSLEQRAFRKQQWIANKELNDAGSFAGVSE